MFDLADLNQIKTATAAYDKMVEAGISFSLSGYIDFLGTVGKNKTVQAALNACDAEKLTEVLLKLYRK